MYLHHCEPIHALTASHVPGHAPTPGAQVGAQPPARTPVRPPAQPALVTAATVFSTEAPRPLVRGGVPIPPTFRQYSIGNSSSFSSSKLGSSGPEEFGSEGASACSEPPPMPPPVPPPLPKSFDYDAGASLYNGTGSFFDRNEEDTPPQGVGVTSVDYDILPGSLSHHCLDRDMSHSQLSSSVPPPPQGYVQPRRERRAVATADHAVHAQHLSQWPRRQDASRPPAPPVITPELVRAVEQQDVHALPDREYPPALSAFVRDLDRWRERLVRHFNLSQSSFTSNTSGRPAHSLQTPLSPSSQEREDPQGDNGGIPNPLLVSPRTIPSPSEWAGPVTTQRRSVVRSPEGYGPRRCHAVQPHA